MQVDIKQTPPHNGSYGLLHIVHCACTSDLHMPVQEHIDWFLHAVLLLRVNTNAHQTQAVRRRCTLKYFQSFSLRPLLGTHYHVFLMLLYIVHTILTLTLHPFSQVQALTAFREVSQPKLGRPIPTRSSSCTNLHQCIPRPPSGGRQPKVVSASHSCIYTVAKCIIYAHAQTTICRRNN